MSHFPISNTGNTGNLENQGATGRELELKPRRTRRMSFWRTALAIVIVGVLAGGGFVGWQWWGASQAVASYDPWFAGYVDVTATPTYPFESPLPDVGSNVMLSFIVASKTDPCEPTWGTFYTLDAASSALDLDRRIARLAQLGGQADISFGGVANDELATGCTDESDLIGAYTKVIERYKTKTIDLDLEGENVANVAAGERRAAAIKAIQDKRHADGNDLGVWVTLAVAPTGLTDIGVAAVKQLLDAGVTLSGVNAMTMDYGGSKDASQSMAQASISALNAVHEQVAALYREQGTVLTSAAIWSMIGATPMIGQNDVIEEIFTLDDAVELNAFAQEKQLGRISMWSMNRDRTCGPNYVNVKRVSEACSGIEQGEQSFSSLLANRFAGATATGVPTTTPTPVGVAENGNGDVYIDDPITSPYEIWAKDRVFQKEAKVVWHGYVYQAKWWTQSDLPDNPALKSFETPWMLLGPVLATDTPRVQIALPVGTYADWSPTTVYNDGTRVLVEGVPYQARWWNQAVSPVSSDINPDSPWRLLTADEVTAVRNGTIDDYARAQAEAAAAAAAAEAR
jgi:chitinase